MRGTVLIISAASLVICGCLESVSPNNLSAARGAKPCESTWQRTAPPDLTPLSVFIAHGNASAQAFAAAIGEHVVRDPSSLAGTLSRSRNGGTPTWKTTNGTLSFVTAGGVISRASWDGNASWKLGSISEATDSVRGMLRALSVPTEGDGALDIRPRDNSSSSMSFSQEIDGMHLSGGELWNSSRPWGSRFDIGTLYDLSKARQGVNVEQASLIAQTFETCSVASFAGAPGISPTVTESPQHGLGILDASIAYVFSFETSARQFPQALCANEAIVEVARSNGAILGIHPPVCVT